MSPVFSTRMASKNQVLFTIIFLSIIGLAVSGYLVKHHYDLLGQSFCDINNVVSCTTVNTSVYSELFRIPVAAFGVLWYIALIAVAVLLWRGSPLQIVLLSLSVAGLLFVGYLVTAEILLNAFCILCTITHVIAVVITLLAIRLYRKKS